MAKPPWLVGVSGRILFGASLAGLSSISTLLEITFQHLLTFTWLLPHPHLPAGGTISKIKDHISPTPERAFCVIWGKLLAAGINADIHLVSSLWCQLSFLDRYEVKTSLRGALQICVRFIKRQQWSFRLSDSCLLWALLNLEVDSLLSERLTKG